MLKSVKEIIEKIESNNINFLILYNTKYILSLFPQRIPERHDRRRES